MTTEKSFNIAIAGASLVFLLVASLLYRAGHLPGMEPERAGAHRDYPSTPTEGVVIIDMVADTIIASFYGVAMTDIRTELSAMATNRGYARGGIVPWYALAVPANMGSSNDGRWRWIDVKAAMEVGKPVDIGMDYPGRFGKPRGESP